MKVISRPIAILVTLLPLLTLTACDRYRVTLNEKVISEPKGLLANIEVKDKALATCIAQNISDRQIKTIEELTTLVCTHAGIKTVEGIQTLSAIDTLNLAQNRLSSISPLLFLGKLKSVNLKDNPQLDCNEVKKLKGQLPRDATLLTPEQCGG